MPEKNQVWDSAFLRESAWLNGLGPVANYFAEFAAWPSLEQYSTFVEERRARFAPECDSVRFVEPKAKRHRAPKTEPIDLSVLYDGSISLRAEVPCFPGSYHDLFNVLIWAAFPRSKRALHARQFRALSAWVPHGATKLPGARTREQDALTVFDEGGSVVVFSKDAAAAFRSAPSGGGIAMHPGTEGEVQLLLFGHALLEHALYQRPKVRSSALIIECDGPCPTGEVLLDIADRAVCARVNDTSAFLAPGIDAVAELSEDGKVWIQGHSPTSSCPN